MGVSIDPVSNRDMVLLVALTVLAATVQATPDQPDFSGRWVLDTPALANPDTARRLVVLQPITWTNVFGEPMKPAFLSISIRREGVSANSEETRRISVVSGITPGLSKEGLTVGNATREETVWRRDSLVFANSSYGPAGPRTGDWTERREEWSLEPDGRLRVEISAESWKSARRVDVYFYSREGAPLRVPRP
jgi:hypothetical protein